MRKKILPLLLCLFFCAIEVVNASIRPLENGDFCGKVMTFSSFSGVDITDKASGATATLASKFSPGFGLKLGYQIHPEYAAFAQYELQRVGFFEPEDQVLEPRAKVLNKISLGITTDLSDVFRVSLKGSASENLYLSSQQSKSLSLNQSWAPTLSLDTRWNFLLVSGWLFNTGLEGVVFLPIKTRQYQINTGFGLLIPLAVEVPLENGKVGDFEVQLGSFFEETSLTKQQTHMLTVSLGFSWWFES